MSDWILMHSKFGGTCITCHGEIENGGQILWKKGEGAKHKECPEKEDEYTPLSKGVPPPKGYYAEGGNWKRMKDSKQYSYKELQDVMYCQHCGILLDHKTTGQGWINDDRRVCRDHFGSHR